MKHRIGCAISFNIFEDMTKKDAKELCDAFGGRDDLFTYLSNNVDFAELRTVRSYSDPDVVASAIDKLNSYGIKATIHGTLDEAEAFFKPYRTLLAQNKKNKYNITVHPVASRSETVRMLSDICDRIEKESYPFYITLENQRVKDGVLFGVCEDVSGVEKEINSPHLGLCFDFGHQLSNTSKGYTDNVSDAFISKVKHTHIHSYYEGTTHYPLDCGKTLFEENITALLENNYEGVFNLELAPDRYSDKFDVKKSFINSVNILKIAIANALNKKNAEAFYKNEYCNTLKELKNKFDSVENCVCLAGPSAYLIKINALRIAVDVATGILPVSESANAYLSDWLKEFDAYIVTHAHRDHYDKKIFEALPDDVIKFVPDFMDVSAPGVIVTHDGLEEQIGDIKLVFFDSAHSLGENIVPEMGFYIEYNGEKYVFPTDVRDYKKEHKKLDSVKILFAHLWLGKGNALNCEYEPYITDFCDFLKSFNAKECRIAHLDDVHRTLDEMWSDVHFNELNKRISTIKSFNVGDLIEF